jgi:DNA polymerase-3 subunit delta'
LVSLVIVASDSQMHMPVKAWPDILEQPTAVDQLRRAYRTDRLPHGLIFAGPAGVGKATTAAFLAHLFLCERPNADEPCGTCESCRSFIAGGHPDYHVITKELIRYHDKTGKSKGIDLSIHVIRPEVVERAAKKSSMGRGKVFVIEQADLMNAAAQNSLLKTLEEPAGRTLIILLTDQIGQMLPTIRSRCQTIRFSQLAESTVIAELKSRGIAPAMAQRAAHISSGSLGIALRWIQDGVIESVGQLLEQLDQVFAGRPADALPDWFKAAAEAYAEKQLKRDELSSKDQANREGLSLFLRLASDHVRARLRVESDPGRLDRSCQLIDAIARAEEYLDANVNVALIFQQLAVAMEHAGAA